MFENRYGRSTSLCIMDSSGKKFSFSKQKYSSKEISKQDQPYHSSINSQYQMYNKVQTKLTDMVKSYFNSLIMHKLNDFYE